MKITGFERELGTGYTAATLAFLKTRYPGVRFVWIMGADNLASSTAGSTGEASRILCPLWSSIALVGGCPVFRHGRRRRCLEAGFRNRKPGL